MSVATCRIPEDIFRVSYSNNPAELPDWKRVGNGRFDDPLGAYRVLYTAESRIGAFIEWFQQFRPNEEIRAIEAEFEWDDDAESLKKFDIPSGTVPFSKYYTLYVGKYTTDTEAILIDLTVDETARALVSVLNREDLTVTTIAADNLQAGYQICRPISRFGYEHEPSFVGLRSISKLHPKEVLNVSLYEGEPDKLRVTLRQTRVESVSFDDQSAQEACGYLGITLQLADEYFASQVYLYGP